MDDNGSAAMKELVASSYNGDAEAVRHDHE
jgi:hypothetical protein